MSNRKIIMSAFLWIGFVFLSATSAQANDPSCEVKLGMGSRLHPIATLADWERKSLQLDSRGDTLQFYYRTHQDSPWVSAGDRWNVDARVESQTLLIRDINPYTVSVRDDGMNDYGWIYVSARAIGLPDNVDCRNIRIQYVSQQGPTPPPPGPRFVTLFSQFDFRGYALRVNGNIDHLGRYGFDDSAASIAVPAGCEAHLFTEPGFRGGPYRVLQSYNSLGNLTYRVSSIAVRCR
jgi:hypothetical protein